MCIRRIEEQGEKAKIVKEILLDLPEWFGIEQSTNAYIQHCKELPVWAYFKNQVPIGCIVVKQTGNATLEIYVMGVKKQYHRLQIGKKLFHTIEDYAVKNNYKFIQVKTVKQGCYKEYDQTNRFYQSIGFYEFECIKTLWDEHNPCQIYVKHI